MASLLEYLNKQYDCVLIDTPALVSYADGVVLATQVRDIIMVIRHGKTTRTEVRNAARRLSGVSAQLRGLVLNGTPKRDSDPYYTDEGQREPEPTPAVEVSLQEPATAHAAAAGVGQLRQPRKPRTSTTS